MNAATETITRKPSLRWRRPKAPTGLARVGWRGGDNRELTYSGEVLARVYAHRGQFNRGALQGWYWVARIGDDLVNTCNALVATREECQEACITWVRAKLAAAT